MVFFKKWNKLFSFSHILIYVWLGRTITSLFFWAAFATTHTHSIDCALNSFLPIIIIISQGQIYIQEKKILFKKKKRIFIICLKLIFFSRVSFNSWQSKQAAILVRAANHRELLLEINKTAKKSIHFFWLA